jgi:error-prone DNA polymerase
MNLLFERFISEDRGEPPDIDVDFEHERREEVIQYIYKRYGRDRAGMVSAVRTYRSKSAFLELSKAIGVQTGTITAYDLGQQFEKLAGEDADKLPLVNELVEELREFPRHLSIHSGGFTLSADPIIETVPIEPARMEDRTIVQWDKSDLDTTGLLKVDVLALGFLTALHKICDLLGKDWRELPVHDEATYDMICRAETEGTFQIESRAQKSMLPRTRPRCFYDLVVQVAIVRPGPNVGNMVRPYVERREMERRGTPYRVPDPDLEPILGRTYGVPIFQEQIMKLAIVKAGFTPGEADRLRRALAAYRSAEAVEAVGKTLYERLVQNGTPRAYAEELLGYVKGYAHYGFPESHAASFALIAYKSAYLKRKHPAEFLCGLINSQPMGFYPIDTLINDAKRNGVVVLPVDPNFSDWDAKMENGRVRMGFRNIHRIRKEQIEALVAERALRPFSDLLDLIQRARLSREVVEGMALADVFRCFGLDQRHTLWKSIEFQAFFESESSEQLPLFQEVREEQKEGLFAKMSLREEICADYQVMGYSLRGNIMRALRQELGRFLPKTTSQSVKKLRHNEPISVSGVLMVLQRPPSAKGVAFMTLEDEFGSMDVTFKPEVFESHEALIRENRFLTVTGVVQNLGQSRSILAQSVVLIPVEEKSVRSIQAGAHPRELGNLFR